MLVAGVNPKVVSERLGHSSVAFTIDVYSHVVPNLQESAAERFDQLIFLESPGEKKCCQTAEAGSGTKRGGYVGKREPGCWENVGKAPRKSRHNWWN